MTWQQHGDGIHETSTSSGRAYSRIEKPTAKINRLMRDLRIVESRLEQSERHTAAVRRVRDSIVEELRLLGA